MKQNPVRVLLVENDHEESLPVLEMLKEKGVSVYTVTRVDDRDSAIGVLRKDAHDIAIIDCGPGGKNVPELLKSICRKPDKMPAILLTGRGDLAVDLEAMKAGAADYLDKNELSPTFLERSIRHAIQKHKVERALVRVNRTLIMLKECCRAIAHSSDEKGLLNEICRIIVEVGGYRFCWAGQVNRADLSIFPSAHAGYERGYLQAIRVSSDETAWGCGPAGTAARIVKPSVIRSIEHDPRFAPWRCEALKRGYASCASLPLCERNQVLGILTVYSGEPDAFGKEEVDLLTDLANEISFGVASLRNRWDRIRAERAFGDQIHFLQHLMDTIPSPVYYKNAAGLYEGCNKAFEDFTGRKRPDIIGKTDLEITSPEMAQTYLAMDDLLFARGGVQNFEGLCKCADESIRQVEFNKAVYCNPDGKPAGLVGILVDVTEKKRKETELRTALSFNMNLIESSPAYFVALYPDGRVKMVNQALVNATGYSRDEILGKDMSVFALEEEIQLSGPVFESVRDEKKPFRQELHMRTKKGGKRLVQWHWQPVLDDTCRTEFVFCMGIDITEQRKAEEQIKALARFPHENPHCVLRISADGTILFANEPASAFLDSWGSENGGTIPSECTAIVSEVLAGGTRKVIEREAGGKILSLTVVPVADGGYANFYGVDITEQKQAEWALRENDRYFRSLLSNMHEDIYVIDGEYRICDANRDFLFTMRKKREEIAGRFCYEVLAANAKPCWITGGSCVVQKVWQTGNPAAGSKEVVRPDGSRFWAEMLCSPLRDGLGRITHVIEAVRDISHEVRLESELRQAQKMEAIGTLAGGISHDFNNILGIILGYSELTLLDTLPGTQQHANLEEIRKASYRGKELVKQILAFSRKNKKEKVPLQICLILREALKLLRPALPSTIEIRLDIETGPDEDLILADPTQMHQVVMNICANAAHAMKEQDGLLEVGLSRMLMTESDIEHFPDLPPGPYVRLSFKDSGHGIAPADIDRIFDPYFTTKGPGEGTGLGLSVVHGIVKEHGGVVTVYSEYGEGSVFRVFLPAIERIESAVPCRIEDIPTGSESILLVDDENAIVDSYGRMLEKLGYRVDGRTDATKALMAFQQSPASFDLVITDHTMPHMTGIELSRQVLKIRPDIPVILCSGNAETVNATAARKAGIREFLIKPFQLHETAAAVRRILDAGARVA